MALPLTETDKFLLLHALGAPESRDRVTALLDLAGTGNMTGPASATDNALARYDGATGALLQNSGVIISDANAVTGVASLNGVTSTGIGYVSGVTSALQTQLDAKLDLSGGTLTGNLSVSNTSGNTLTLSKSTNAPLLKFEGGSNDISFEIFTTGAGGLRYLNNALTEIGSFDQNGKFTFGASSGTQTHAVNGQLTASIAVAAGAGVITMQNTDTTGRSRLRSQGNDGDALVDYRNSAHGTSGVLLASQAVFRGTGPGGVAFGSENASGDVVFFAGGTASGNQYGSFSAAGAWTLGATGGAQIHRINGATVAANADTLTFTNGPTGTAGNPDIYLELNINGTNYVFPGFAV